MADRDLIANLSAVVSRAMLAANLGGKSFGGERDLYEVLGYPRYLRPLDYVAMYERDDIAARIVEAYPDATWSAKPSIIEDSEGETTQFEREIDDLVEKKKLFHYMHRADKLANLGRYSILILGVNDGSELRQPLRDASKIHWMMPVTEALADISVWNQDPLSPDFGKPEMYRVTFGEQDSTKPNVIREVHKSRVIHIAEKCQQDDVYGEPRLRRVYNKITDLQKVSGGAAEMFWLGARQGLIFEADEDAQIGDVDALEDQAAEFQHQLRRLLTTQGGKWKTLESQNPQPREIYDILLDMIAGASGIPKRILVGAEAGQLASSQDETAWLARVRERRTAFVEPSIIRATIDRLIELGVISAPRDGTYLVEWDHEAGMSQTEIADIASKKTASLVAYSNAPYAEQIMPPTEFRKEILGLEEEPPGGFPKDPPPIPPEDDVVFDNV